ncbi:Agamous-like MADS-box protein AGL62 [Linum grandiflorum]
MKRDQGKKPNIGRQKIEIKKVEKDSNRNVTFSKRKNGLFKKATELSTLCGAQVAIILFSQHHRVFSCARPDLDSVLNRYQLYHQNSSNSTLTNHHHNDNNAALNFYGDCNASFNGMPMMTASPEQEYVEAVERLEEWKIVAGLPPVTAAGFWWEDLEVDEMEETDEVESCKESLMELKKKVSARLGSMSDANGSGGHYKGHEHYSADTNCGGQLVDDKGFLSVKTQSQPIDDSSLSQLFYYT